MRLLNPCSSVNYPRARQLGGKSGHALAKLAHFRERANLRFKGLIVLPLDLQLRLQLLHKQVQMGNLDAKLLDVACCRSRPDQ